MDDELRKMYMINIRLAVIIGLCSGVMTGIFSLELSHVIQMPDWAWVVAFLFTIVAIIWLLVTYLNDLKRGFQ
jgi:hypothetical protein